MRKNRNGCKREFTGERKVLQQIIPNTKDLTEERSESGRNTLEILLSLEQNYQFQITIFKMLQYICGPSHQTKDLPKTYVGVIQWTIGELPP